MIPLPTARLLPLAGLTMALLFASGFAHADDTDRIAEAVEPPSPSGSPNSIYDSIWGSSLLYKADNGFLTELALQGRIHLQAAEGWSDRGEFGTRDRPGDVRWGDIEVRRFRVGFKSKLMFARSKPVASARS